MDILKETLIKAELAASDEDENIKIEQDGTTRDLSRLYVQAAIGHMEARGETSVKWRPGSACPCIPGCPDYPGCQYGASGPP